MIKKYIVEITNDVDSDAFEKFESEYNASEIVHCRDCAYAEKERVKGEIFCPVINGMRDDEWFYADGKR